MLNRKPSPEPNHQKLRSPKAVKAPLRKPRIDAIDGCRFTLVFPIVIAHFARFSTGNKTALRLLTQENVLVGGFFVISGYVSGYTSTLLGERKADEKKLAKPELFFWQRVMAYYPLHFLVLLILTPMFVWTERRFKTPWGETAFRAFLSYTMLQAWFPKEGEIWNQPTWFLSALTFANLTMPTMVLPRVAALSKSGLHKLFCGLTSISLLQKISCSEASAFHTQAVLAAPKYPLLWNLTRFHPFWATIEMIMGIAAARDIMLDTPEDKKKQHTNPALWLAAAFSTLFLRLTKYDFNDGIIRSALFVPLWTKFLTSIHRDCLSPNPRAMTRFMGSSLMAQLGSLAFPMFILHGPIGQIFYKKVIATKLWGQPMPNSFFPVYCLVCLITSHLVNEGFVKSKKVVAVAGDVAQWLASKTEGMLQDS